MIPKGKGSSLPFHHKFVSIITCSHHLFQPNKLRILRITLPKAINLKGNASTFESSLDTKFKRVFGHVLSGTLGPPAFLSASEGIAGLIKTIT
jgi:hypothetical protein